MSRDAAPAEAPSTTRDEVGEETTEGTLLGGRVAYRQLARRGHRTGIEPVLLAAAVPAEAGARVVEGGTGAGAGLLCLAHRVPDLRGIGIEADPALAALARANLAANGRDTCEVRCDRLPALTTPLTMEREAVDHAFANPPWFAPADTPSPDRLRVAARQAGAGLLASWARALAAWLRRGGTLTLIVPASSYPAASAALAEARCGGLVLCPLWRRAGAPPRLVLLRGVAGSRGPARISPGLTLHDETGRFTAEADAILRDGAPLPL